MTHLSSAFLLLTVAATLSTAAFTPLWNISNYFMDLKSPVAIYAGRVTVTDGIAVSTFDEATGAPLNRVDSLYTTPPAAQEGLIVTADMNGGVGAIDALTFAQVWGSTHAGHSFHGAPQFGFSSGRPAVFLVAKDGTFFGLLASNGQKLFAAESLKHAAPVGTTWETADVSLSADFAAVTNGPTVYLVALNTGDVKAHFTVPGTYPTKPLFTGGRVFVGDSFGNFFGLDGKTLKQLWNESTNNISSHVRPAVSTCGQIIFYGDVGGYVWAFNASTGATVWGSQVGTALISATIAVVKDTIFVGSMDSNVYAVNATTGAMLGNWNAGASVGGSLVTKDTVVYVPTYADILFAIHFSQ